MHKTLLLVLLAASCFGQNAAKLPVSYPRVVAKVALTGQTAPIPTTTLFTPAKDGLYRISSYGVVTVPSTSSGLWEVQLNWTDDSGPQGCAPYPIDSGGPSPSPCVLLGLYSDGTPGINNYGQGFGSGYYNPPNTTAVVQAKAGAAITYSVVADPNSGGSPTGSTFELFISVEQLMQF
jgi:hypothetical protein